MKCTTQYFIYAVSFKHAALVEGSENGLSRKPWSPRPWETRYPRETSSNGKHKQCRGCSVPLRVGEKKETGEYVHYSPEVKAKIARYAIDNGPTKAAKHFSKVLEKNISESTVRGFKSSYILQSAGKESVNKLTTKSRGRPTLLPNEMDNDVKDYIRDLRESGGILNTNIVQCIGKGVVLEKNKSLLLEYGGSIELTREWARSVLDRMNFKKLKATKGIKHKPNDFDKLKSDFIERIDSAIGEDDIPSNLVFNWDQTGLNMVPQCSWTMEEQGSKQVKVAGSGDKRQITALLCATLSGTLLPPQLIYQGTTSQCEPKVKFPESWCITHSENHWSTESTMIQYVDEVVVPYVEGIRESLPIKRNSQKALAIFDVFAANRSQAF